MKAACPWKRTGRPILRTKGEAGLAGRFRLSTKEPIKCQADCLHCAVNQRTIKCQENYLVVEGGLVWWGLLDGAGAHEVGDEVADLVFA